MISFRSSDAQAAGGERCRYLLGTAVGLCLGSAVRRPGPKGTRLFAVAVFLSFAAPGAAKAAVPPPPFSPSSPFNVPIAADPAIDRHSGAMVRRLVEAADTHGFWVAVKKWSVPVYFATRRSPRRNVRLTAWWAPRRMMYGVRIPRRARPDPEGDGHMVVVDQARGCEYDFWQARKRANGWSASWGNRIRLRSTGVFPGGFAARASGFALRAGQIRPSELRAGNIRHALIFSFPYTKAGPPVWPATSSDGWSRAWGAMPMGARVQLDPAFRLDSVRLTRWQKTIARALKRYGMILADTSGGPIGLSARNPQSFRRNPYRGVLPNLDSVRLPSELIAHMRVLKLPPLNRVPGRIIRNGCAPMR